MPVKNGNKVKVEYEGKLNDGTLFDSTEKQGKPLEFEVGAKHVIKGFEDAVIGMEKGDEKDVKLKPEEAYGNYNPDLVKKVPRDEALKGKELKPGAMLLMTLPNGAKIPATVKGADEETVTIDINHPLVDKELNFKIKVVDYS